MPIHYDVTIFDNTDATPILGTVDGGGNVTQASFSTDPAHPRSYLKVPEEFGDAEIDFQSGTSLIGQINFEVVDKRLTANDQDTGIVTANIRTVLGESSIIGHRVLIRMIGASTIKLLDGVIYSVKLQPDLVTYAFVARDPREREKLGRLFPSAALRTSGAITQAPTVLPRGSFANYGRTFGDSLVLRPAVKPLTGVYNSTRKQIRWPSNTFDRDRLRDYQILTDKMLEAGTPTATYDETGLFIGWFCDRVSVLWRAAGTSDPWTESANNLAFMPQDEASPVPNLFVMDGNSKYRGQEARGIVGIKVDPRGGAGPVPTNNQSVDFMVVYTGPPSEDYPCLVQGTVGQILKDICDAKYCDAQDAIFKVRYNSTVMNALVTNTPQFRTRITETVEDRKEWLEENIYQPYGLVPTLDDDWLLAPIKYRLPDPSITLTQLDDSNSDIDVEWGHDAQTAITVVEIELIMEMMYDAVTDPFMKQTAGDGIQEWVIRKVYKSASAALLGEHVLSFKPKTVRDYFEVSTPLGSYELPGEAALRLIERKSEIFDRYRYGAQKYVASVSRSDAAVAARKVGDWVLLAHSWLPDYATGTRGLNRLGQIVGIQDVSFTRRRFVIEDAGAANSPVGQPTIGTVTVDSDGVVSIPITAVAAGTEARIEVANNATAPGANSGLWTFAGRAGAGVTVKTAPQPGGTTLWYRARGEGEGKRPSAFTTPASIAVPNRPAIIRFKIEQDPTSGRVRVSWEVNAYTLGMKLYYDPHDSTVDPVFIDNTNQAASGLTYLFPITNSHQGFNSFSVKAIPTQNADGSGAQGRSVVSTIAINDPEGVSVDPILDADGGLLYLIPNRSKLARSIRFGVLTSTFPTLDAVRASSFSSDAVIHIHTYSALGETAYVGVIPMTGPSGDGEEGEPWFGLLTFSNSDEPVVSVYPIEPSVDTKEAVRLIVTDNGDQVFFNHRVYDAGAGPPGYTRTPGSGYVSDPQVIEIEVDKPAEGAVHKVIEYYAGDDSGNMTKPAQIRIDGDAVPSGDIDIDIHEDGTLFAIPNSFDLSDTGSVRVRIVVGLPGSDVSEALTYTNDVDGTDGKVELAWHSGQFKTRFDTGIKLIDGQVAYVLYRFFRTTSVVGATQNGSRRSDEIKKQRMKGSTGNLTGTAKVVTLQLAETSANIMTATMELENTARWEAYEKNGSYPTLDGLLGGVVDPIYKRHETSGPLTTWEHWVEAGTWYVIVVPYNAKEQAGVRKAAQLTITGSSTNEGVISDYVPEYIHGGGYILIPWTNNAAIESGGGRYRIQIYRNGTSIVSDRDARMDDNGTVNVNGVGGYRDTGPDDCVEGTPDCFYQTIEYLIFLSDNLSIVPTKLYTVYYSDFLAGTE